MYLLPTYPFSLKIYCHLIEITMEIFTSFRIMQTMQARHSGLGFLQQLSLKEELACRWLLLRTDPKD